MDGLVDVPASLPESGLVASVADKLKGIGEARLERPLAAPFDS
jgi:hypothetical protein